MVVDDHPENIELLEAFLVPQGYEVVGATTGEEALKRLSSNEPMRSECRAPERAVRARGVRLGGGF